MPWRRRLPVVRPPDRQPTFQGFFAAGEGVAAEKTEAVVEVVDGALGDAVRGDADGQVAGGHRRGMGEGGDAARADGDGLGAGAAACLNSQCRLPNGLFPAT